MSSPNAKTRHKFSPDPSPVARLRHQFQPEAKKPEASHVEIGIINEKYKLPNVTQQLSTKSIVASSNERINQEKGGNSEFQLGKSGRPSESTDTVDSMFNAYTFSAKKQKSTPQANSTLQPNRYVPSSKPPSALRRGSLLHSENSIAPPGTNVRRSPSIQSSAISDADKSSTIARNRPVYEIKEVTIDFSSFPLLYRISFWFMLPSFDGKGKRVAATFFEAGDLESIEFRKHGLHPKSWFNTGWDFILSLAYFVCLWVIPFVICFDLTDQVVLIFRIL
ncbi:hypothetical protein BCR33DRAFT_572142 [Rhizoclosmatium globosum]|uniref:Uncharacterized protein n=1 Tax=Rhizoclosmatium globosum TaxID=329046 RepID=A0A1Y2B515_9FUNG|nr:hypothetical protein BCR33DRAFT_572142 [Rhizoclosmatium globosum]|eukprot:ORY29913.1 hypothetical protein BCR33DRAFT_572142 [Rhizoclosmatium globosum]